MQSCDVTDVMASDCSILSATNAMNSSPPSSSLVACFSNKERESISGLSLSGLVSCSLKRKRPPKIEIPNVLREISIDTFKKCSAQGPDDGAASFADSGVGVFSLKGKKKFMEDAHKIFSSSNDKKEFFGVYDGHGGSKAAEFVVQNLHLNVFEMLENASESKAKEEAIKAGYLKTDEEFLKQGIGSGACCVTAIIEGQELMVSNLGDCRAVVCRGGVAEVLTTDHRPTREDERRRIEDKGGYVEIHRGTWRVHGTLAVSRSIGDAHLKDWVMAEPDTKIISLVPDMEYLILASDGLWEEVSNQEAVDIVTKVCSSGRKLHARSSSTGTKGGICPCTSPIPSSKSPRISLVKSKRILYHHTCHKRSAANQKTSEDESYCENGSPPSKSRRISLVKQMKIKTQFPNNEDEDLNEKPASLVKQMKIKTQFPNNENEDLNEKPAFGGLLGACKELVNLAVSRGSLDDVTVMVVDLNHYKQLI